MYNENIFLQWNPLEIDIRPAKAWPWLSRKPQTSD